MKTFTCKWLATLALLVLCSTSLSAKTPKYIFFCIGDGMSFSHVLATQLYYEHGNYKAGNESIAFLDFPVHSAVRTHANNSLITCSAAAATALATGHKTNIDHVGISPDKKPLTSIAKQLRDKGYAIGLVTSGQIDDATPAAFYASQMRKEAYLIGKEGADSQFDYLAGSALKQPYAPSQPSLYDYYRQKGYTICRGIDGYNANREADKMLLLDADTASRSWLPYAIDREPEAMGLEFMVQAGIDKLKQEKGKKGFFMMIEGGSIDWCGHANEAATNLMEVLALDKAVRAALEFAQKHPDETLIVVTGDHETGGMTMGFAGTGYALYVDRLAKQKCSIGRFGELLKKARSAKEDFDFDDACAMLTKYFGFEFSGDGPMKISDSELKTLREAFEQDKLPDAARRVMNAKAGVGWTSGAHTALPVLTTSYGKKADVFTGFIDNTDIANRLKTLVK